MLDRRAAYPRFFVCGYIVIIGYKRFEGNYKASLLLSSRRK
nr:MAG TPA: hypothetical protein [Caudoviricetes sp.]